MLQHVQQLFLVGGVRFRAVSFHHIHPASQVPKAFGKDASGHFGPGDKHLFIAFQERLHLSQQVLRLVLCRHAVGMKAVTGELASGGRSDGPDFHVAQGPGVPTGLVETPEEGIYPVLAGKNKPVIHFQTVQRFIHAFEIIRGIPDGNGRDFQGFSALLVQYGHQPGSLAPGTGDNDSFSKERTVVKPPHFFSQLHHIAYHKDSRRLDSHVDYIFRCLSQGGGICFLVGTGAPANKSSRRIGASSILHKLGSNESSMAYAHKENKGIHAAGQFVPVNGGLVLIGILMAGNDRKGSSHAAMGDRNACIGRGRNGTCNAGHFFKIHARFPEYFDFLSSPAENEGIPAFETGHNLPFLSLFRQEKADFMLLHGVTSGLFAHVHILRIRPGVPKEPLVRQVVTYDDVRFFQAPLPFQCQKFRISGTCTD